MKEMHLALIFSNIMILFRVLINISAFFVHSNRYVNTAIFTIVLFVCYDLSLVLLSAVLCDYHVLLSGSC